MLTTNLIKSVGQVDIEFGLETFGPTRCSQTLGAAKIMFGGTGTASSSKNYKIVAN